MLVADLHLHSRYSRATARNLDLEHIHLWACRKGVDIIGTGDFTHPEWFATLNDRLVPAEEGLFRLRPDLARAVESELPPACRREVRFILQAEISNIYKHGERVRKVHNLVFFPDLDSVARFRATLDQVGNLNSDGRPILGLDSRDLLEIALNTNPQTLFIPAHIWTPWFSALGSKSGFDSIAACYRDLAGHIHAVETGLSSDPPMNWRVSSLDPYVLVSNSDAHSPARIAREATLFDTPPDYHALAEALRTGDGLAGTIEFYPEEGKYHLDGHRKCQARLDPEDTTRLDGRCPVCGRPVTVGVLNRVVQLADRPPGKRPPKARDFHSLVALDEVIAEVLGLASRTSKRVQAIYHDLLARFGPELQILRHTPLEDLAHHDRRLAEAIGRVRDGTIHVEGGYDGEFGVVKVFPPSRPRDLGLFPPPARRNEPTRAATKPERTTEVPTAETRPETATDDLDEKQHTAVTAPLGNHVVVAGPGTGKTRVLTRRIAHLLGKGLPPHTIVALTFTRRAAREMRERLTAMIGLDTVAHLTIGTFHALALDLLTHHRQERGKRPLAVADPEDVTLLARDEGIPEREIPATLRALGLIRLQDILPEACRLLAAERKKLGPLANPRALLVDELQDIDNHQFEMLRHLAQDAEEFFVIGDPNQAIYSFRGASPEFFHRLTEDREAQPVTLATNYRSRAEIQAISAMLLGLAPWDDRLGTRGEGIALATAPTAAAEAEYVAHTIERLVGGMASFSFNSDRVDTYAPEQCTFGDIAVLARTGFALDALDEALSRLGVPTDRPGRPTATYRNVTGLLAAALRYARNQADHLAARRLQKHAAAQVRAGEQLSITRLVSQLRKWRSPDMVALTEHLAAQLFPNPEEVTAAALARTREAIAAHSDDPDALLWNLTVQEEGDRVPFHRERVTLLTLHAAKGLEFDVVFVCGLEEGLLPYSVSGTPSDPEEERRLLYVGMTRARRLLYLTHAHSRTLFGQRRELPCSPFLTEIADRLTDARRTAPKKRRPTPRPTPRRLL